MGPRSHHCISLSPSFLNLQRGAALPPLAVDVEVTAPEPRAGQVLAHWTYSGGRGEWGRRPGSRRDLGSGVPQLWHSFIHVSMSQTSAPTGHEA